MGLPIATHTTAEGRAMTGAPTPAGYPARYLEYHTNLALNPMAQMVSMVTEGVFVRFPELRIIQMEAGISWVPPLLWRLDADWKQLRSEVPHLAELPSTYVKRHYRFGTQPIEEPNDPSRLLETWSLVDGEHTLLFSSDYPHWDFDDPYRALPARLPAAWRRRILRENARDLFADKLRLIEGPAGAGAPPAAVEAAG
jgi:predicted TIM-barrel fold metal-dependent hydrolase